MSSSRRKVFVLFVAPVLTFECGADDVAAGVGCDFVEAHNKGVWILTGAKSGS